MRARMDLILNRLRKQLQQAIELEHSTIPPYLTAYWSLRPGSNEEARAAIRDVVVEEMLHMALACNLLNAVGGSPVIDHQGFVPSFPGSLPHGVRPDLTVRLRRASIPHIRDTFMQIEEPHMTLDPEHPDRPRHHHKTIGQYYHHIRHAIEHLGDDAFTGDPGLQVDDWRGTGDLYAVTDVESAKQAIDEIVEQGEGACSLEPDDGYDELAHYYRFQEIVEGRRLVKEGDLFSFTGEPIPFDETAVVQIIDDPLVGRIEVEESRNAVERFNGDYREMLAELHRAFNGEPAALDGAIGTMFRLSSDAAAVMAMPALHDDDPTRAAPSFELPA